jgi:hypothetical protein
MHQRPAPTQEGQTADEMFFSSTLNEHKVYNKNEAVLGDSKEVEVNNGEE